MTNSNAPPSRHDNPFATCWIKPGALPFRFADGETADQIVSQLADRWWRGAIVGPHGSGKSALIETLKPIIAAAGRQAIQFTLHSGQRRLPPDVWDILTRREPLGSSRRDQPSRLIIIDGYEQLSCFERWRFNQRCRNRHVGILVTSHTPVQFPAHIPTLFSTAPDRKLVSQLVADLSTKVSTRITSEDVSASHACHGSNVREIFFDLYDCHELRRRNM